MIARRKSFAYSTHGFLPIFVHSHRPAKLPGHVAPGVYGQGRPLKVNHRHTGDSAGPEGLMTQLILYGTEEGFCMKGLPKDLPSSK